MAEQFEHQQDDEINLAELFATLAHKFSGLISVSFFSGYYAVTVDKEYTASAVFEIKKMMPTTKSPGDWSTRQSQLWWVSEY